MQFTMIGYLLNTHKDQTEHGFFRIFVEDHEKRQLSQYLTKEDTDIYPFEIWLRKEVLSQIPAAAFIPGNTVLLHFEGECCEREGKKTIFDQRGGYGQRSQQQQESREYVFGRSTYVALRVVEVKGDQPQQAKQPK